MAKWHGSLVAAKIIKDSSAIALGDFRSELDVLRRVHHPNAVQFLGACTKQQPYILVSGDSSSHTPHVHRDPNAAFEPSTPFLYKQPLLARQHKHISPPSMHEHCHKADIVVQ